MDRSEKIDGGASNEAVLKRTIPLHLSGIKMS